MSISRAKGLRRDALTPTPECSMTTQNKWSRCNRRRQKKKKRREHFRSLLIEEDMNVVLEDVNDENIAYIRADNFTNPLSFIKFENSPFVVKSNPNKTDFKFRNEERVAITVTVRVLQPYRPAKISVQTRSILLVVSMEIRITPTAVQLYRLSRIMVSFPSCIWHSEDRAS